MNALKKEGKEPLLARALCTVPAQLHSAFFLFSFFFIICVSVNVVLMTPSCSLLIIFLNCVNETERVFAFTTSCVSVSRS